MLTQNTWRMIGGVAIFAAALMAWNGAEELDAGHTKVYLLVYWGLFLVLLITAVYMAILDLRYIKLQYLIGQRELFQKTVDDDMFREALAARLKESSAEPAKPTEDDVRRN